MAEMSDTVEEEFLPDIGAVDGVFASAAGFVNAQHGRLVAATLWLLEHPDDWHGDGLWTPEAYVRWRTGVGAAVASKIADVARRASEFPTCVAALQRGELSLDQIAPIVRHAPGWCDQQIAELAAKCTVAQISKIAREYTWDSPTPPDADSDDPEPDETDHAAPGADSPAATKGPTQPADEAWFGWDDSGRFRLNLNVGADTGLLIETALNEARDAQLRAGNTIVDTVDAVIEMANRSLDTVTSPERRNRYRVNIHLDHQGQPSDPRADPSPALLPNGSVATPCSRRSGGTTRCRRERHRAHPDRHQTPATRQGTPTPHQRNLETPPRRTPRLPLGRIRQTRAASSDLIGSDDGAAQESALRPAHGALLSPR